MLFPAFLHPNTFAKTVLANSESTWFAESIGELMKTLEIQYKTRHVSNSLDGGSSALVIGFLSRPILRPPKLLFKTAFWSLKNCLD